MQPSAILLQKFIEQEFVLLLADKEEIPNGMVEHHQHIRQLIQRN
jgi:hypothetical protein